MIIRLNGSAGTGFELLAPVSLIAGASRFVRQDVYRSRLPRSIGDRNQCASLVSLTLACAPESKSMPIVVSVNEIDRHALQTQFPPSAIELRNGPQFWLPSFHSASTTAAAANPSATPINGLSTANQKEMFQSEFSGVGFLFMPLSQAFEDRHFRKFEIFLPMLGRSTTNC